MFREFRHGRQLYRSAAALPQWVFRGHSGPDGTFVPYGDVGLFHQITSQAVLAGWTIERTSGAVIVRGPAFRWWRGPFPRKSSRKTELTAPQEEILRSLKTLREEELQPTLDEWQAGTVTAEEREHFTKAQRKERRLLRGAVREGLQDHPDVRQWVLTARSLGQRDTLRGTGLEKRTSAPFMARAKRERLAHDAAKIDAVLRLLDRGLNLHRVYQTLKEAGLVTTKWSAFYRWAKRRGLTSQ